jgi:putative adhesin
MLTTLATLAALALAQQTDTTVPVRAGARLEINNFGGEIAVKTWNRNAVRVVADHSSRDRIRVDASDQVVRVKTEPGRRGPSQIDYAVTVPAWMALNLSGVYTDINVAGAQNEITAETVQGEITVLGGSGNVSLKSVMGAVTLEKARGRIDLSSVNEEIRATEVSGDLTAETVNGDITLTHIESANVDANTVNGDITYDGTIKDGGRYRFGTHDGDVLVSVPEKANAAVSVSTFNGEFSACFPVQVTGKTKHRFNFTLGSGTARVELESFGGDIRVCPPGQLLKEKDKHQQDHQEE